MSNKSSYTAGHFALDLDGHTTTSYLRSVDGGYPKQSTIDSPVGSEVFRIKQQGVSEIDPMTIDFGMSGAKHVLNWIRASWNKDWSKKSGQITHADANGNSVFEHEFMDALVTETTFPTLDGGSKEAAYLKVKFQPSNVVLSKGDGHKIFGITGAKQKSWLASSFRLHIEGVEGMENTNRIDSFSIKQGFTKFYSGEQRWAELLPMNVKFPNITGTISEAKATGLLAWNQRVNYKGVVEASAQTFGWIEFLSPSRTEVLFRLNLFDVGISSVSTVQANAGADSIKRLKFELFVGRMDIDADGALGLDAQDPVVFGGNG